MENTKITSSERKHYLVISDEGLITSLGLNTIRRLNKIKKASFSITKVSLKDLSEVIKNFKAVTYEGYTKEKSKRMSTDSYLYLAIHIKFFMMINLCCPVITQNTSTQNIPNLHVYST